MGPPLKPFDKRGFLFSSSVNTESRTNSRTTFLYFYIYNMEKGFLILIGTFVVVGIVHFVSMRTTKLSETKKTHYRKFFWYFYGIIFMLSGGINIIEKGEFHWSFTLQFIMGLVTIILNLLGKIETNTKKV